jgi:hypothetical protein
LLEQENPSFEAANHIPQADLGEKEGIWERGERKPKLGKQRIGLPVGFGPYRIFPTPPKEFGTSGNQCGDVDQRHPSDSAVKLGLVFPILQKPL